MSSGARLRPERRRSRLDRVAGGAARARARGDRGGRRARSGSRSSTARPAGSCPSSLRPAADRRGRHGHRLLDAVDGARPAGRRDDRDDRPRPLADRPRPGLVAPGRDRRRADRRRQPAGARGVRGRAGRAGPRRARSTSAFIDALKEEYLGLRRGDRAAARPRRARRGRQRPLVGAGVGRPPKCRVAARRRALRAFDRAILRDSRFNATILPVGDGLLVAGLPRLTAAMRVARSPVRHPARAGRDARGRARAAPTAPRSRTAGTALVGRFPVLAPGRPSVRFARNGDYADATTTLADGDELACIPPVSGGRRAGPTIRVIQLRSRGLPDRARRGARGEAGDARPTARSSSSPGGPARRRGRRRPGQEAEAARHAGRRVDGLEYEAHEPMAEAVLGQIADEVAERFGVLRLAIVHRTGAVPLGEVSILVVAAAPHRDAAFAAARYAIDETKARAPIWKAERFSDGHVWIGAPARTGAQPPTRTAAARSGDAGRDREGLPQRRHGGDRRDQPPPARPGARTAGYPAAVELMTGEANAAIAGAFDGGATDVLVNDSHGGMYNLRPEGSTRGRRCSRARRRGRWSPARDRIAGSGWPCSSATTPGPGNPLGTIAHTYSSRPVRSTLNGTARRARRRSTRSRSGRGACRSAWSPGDDVLAAEMADWFPWAERVVVKEGFGRNAAASVHPSVARERVRAGAERAVRRAIAGELRPARARAAVRDRGHVPERAPGRLRLPRPRGRAGRRDGRAVRRRRSGARLSRVPGRDQAGRARRLSRARLAMRPGPASASLSGQCRLTAPSG